MTDTHVHHLTDMHGQHLCDGKSWRPRPEKVARIVVCAECVQRYAEMTGELREQVKEKMPSHD